MLYLICRADMVQNGTYTKREMDFESWVRVVTQNSQARIKSYIAYQVIADFLSAELRMPIVVDCPTGEGLVYDNGDLIMEARPVGSLAFKRCRREHLRYAMIVYQGRDARGIAKTMADDW